MNMGYKDKTYMDTIRSAMHSEADNRNSTEARNFTTSKHYAGTQLPRNAAFKVPAVQVPIDEIRLRSVNDFDMQMQTITLEQSIEIQLINPISVVEEPDEKTGTKYYVVTGNRRLVAFRNLRRKYQGTPKESRFSKIPAFVYRIGTEEEKQLAQVKGDYSVLTKEDEEQMYRDANFESRQISQEDAYKHIEYLIGKVESNENEFMAQAEQRMKAVRGRNGRSGATHTMKKVSRAAFISDVLTNDLKLPGFSKRNVERYLKVREVSPELAEEIRQGRISLIKAYDRCMGTAPEKTATDGESKAFATCRKQIEQVRKNLDGLNEDERKELYREIRNLEAALMVKQAIEAAG